MRIRTLLTHPFLTATSLLALASCATESPFAASASEADDTDAAPGAPDAEEGLEIGTEPTELRAIDGFPIYLAAGDSKLFWLDARARTFLRLGGTLQGDPESSAAAARGLFSLTREGDNLAALDDTNQVYLHSENDFASAPVALADLGEEVPNIALAGDYIYFTVYKQNDDNTQGQLARIAREGGDIEVLHDPQFAPVALATNATHIYWSTYREVHRAPLANPTNVETLANGLGNVWLIETRGNDVCWDSFSGEGDEDSELWCRIAGQTERIAAGRPSIADIALTDHSVFWSEQHETEDSQLFQYTFASGVLRPIAAARLLIDIETQGNLVYWFELEGDGPSPESTLWAMRDEG